MKTERSTLGGVGFPAWRWKASLTILVNALLATGREGSALTCQRYGFSHSATSLNVTSRSISFSWVVRSGVIDVIDGPVKREVLCWRICVRLSVYDPSGSFSRVPPRRRRRITPTRSAGRHVKQEMSVQSRSALILVG